MPSDGIATVSAGQKRAADDGFDPLTSPINLKSTPPYDLKTDEQALHSVTRSKEWDTYGNYEQQIERLLTEPSAKLDYKDKFIQGLLDLVNECITNRELGKVIVGITGPMGMGKSAMLNSLFGVGIIAREGDLGGSCTLASCLYQARKKDQVEPFVAEVNFFSRKERRQILANYLAAYYQANHADGEDEEASQGNPQCAEDAEANLDIRNEVIHTLVSLFGNQPECRTKQDCRDFLDCAKSQQDQAILGKLYAWCDSLFTRATGDKSVVTISASTSGELCKALEDFTAYAEDDNGNLAVSLTPMVSLIKHYFDCPLTRLGIWFLDTPGWSDRNRVRRMSALKHRKICTHSIILSDEARVKDDSGISKEVKTGRNRGPGRTVIVITRSDVIRDTTMPSGSKKDKERRDQLKRGVDRFAKELNALEIEENDATEAEDHQRTAKLSKDKRVLEVRKKLVENAERAHRIAMRSESNKRALEEKLLDITPNLPPILSISNTEYARHVEGYKAKNTPVLDVEQTNIPALRRIISKFPNEARLNEITNHQEGNLPALLNRIRLYTARSPSDRKADMEYHVVSPKNRYAKRLMSIFAGVEEEVPKVLGTVRAQQEVWKKLAGGLCDRWYAEFKTGAFLGLLKREGHRRGNYRTREVNLSAELIDINSQEMEAVFSKTIPWILDFEKMLADDMDDLVSDMIQQLKQDSNEPFMALGPFYDYVYTEKVRLPGYIKATFKALVNGIDDIRRRVTTDDEDAYIVEAMLPIYGQVRLLKGGKGQTEKPPKGGWPAHRKFVLKEEITKHNGIWASVYGSVESEFKELLRVQSEGLIQTVGKVFDDIHTGFNLMCEETDEGNPDLKLVQEQLKVNVEQADQILKGPMQEAYEALIRDFRGVGVTEE